MTGKCYRPPSSQLCRAQDFYAAQYIYEHHETMPAVGMCFLFWVDSLSRDTLGGHALGT